MAKLKWDQQGERFYETGVSECVLFVKGGTDAGDNGYQTGVAWNGVTAITQSPSGAEPTALYADNIKYLNLLSAEEFAATVEAYMYPDAFKDCNGEKTLLASIPGVTAGQQKRSAFALAYKTKKGNDEDPDKGYILHIIYGCLAAPSEKAYATVNDSPEAITFSWEVSTTPVEIESVAGMKPTALIEIDSTKFTTTNEGKLTSIINSIYGTDPVGSGQGTDPTLLLPDEIYDILSAT